jgi:hypothetical protein
MYHYKKAGVTFALNATEIAALRRFEAEAAHAPSGIGRPAGSDRDAAE